MLFFFEEKLRFLFFVFFRNRLRDIENKIVVTNGGVRKIGVGIKR